MLRFWNGFVAEGHQIYQDDEDTYKFYLMPRQPTIARNSAGKLSFMFRKYRFADASKALGKGGGYVMFDVSLQVPDATVARILSGICDRYSGLLTRADQAEQKAAAKPDDATLRVEAD